MVIQFEFMAKSMFKLVMVNSYAQAMYFYLIMAQRVQILWTIRTTMLQAIPQVLPSKLIIIVVIQLRIMVLIVVLTKVIQVAHKVLIRVTQLQINQLQVVQLLIRKIKVSQIQARKIPIRMINLSLIQRLHLSQVILRIVISQIR